MIRMKIMVGLFLWLNIYGQHALADEGFRSKLGYPQTYAFHSGDDPAWADPDFDDSTWAKHNVRSFPSQSWEGTGWFRYVVEVDPSLYGQPLALNLRHMGAVEVYIDGQKVGRFGEPAASRDAEVGALALYPAPMGIVFQRPASEELGNPGGKTKHLLALRCSNLFLGVGPWGGLRGMYDFRIDPLEGAIRNYRGLIEKSTANQFLVLGFFLAGFVVFLFLFLNHRSRQDYLFFSLFALCFGLFAYYELSQYSIHTPGEYLSMYRGTVVFFVLALLLGLRTTYGIALPEPPKLVWWGFVVVLLVYAVASWISPIRLANYLNWVMILVFLEVLRTCIMAFLRKEHPVSLEGWVLFGALVVVILAGLGNLLAGFGVLRLPWRHYEFPHETYAVGIMVLAMVFYAARKTRAVAAE